MENPHVWSIIQAAGWPIWPLIVFSIAALALTIERVLALRRSLVMPAGFADQMRARCVQGMPTFEVIQSLRQHSVLGRTLAHALSALIDQPQLPAAVWRTSFEEAGQLAVTEMQRYLSALATIASAAPLLGLLGTVIGMIDIFAAQSMGVGTDALADPTVMAHGISVALYNTAFGLMIAIPSLVVWRALRARVDAYTLELEVEAERFWRHVAPVLCQTSKAGRTSA